MSWRDTCGSAMLQVCGHWSMWWEKSRALSFLCAGRVSSPRPVSGLCSVVPSAGSAATADVDPRAVQPAAAETTDRAQRAGAGAGPGGHTPPWKLRFAWDHF